MNEKSNLQVVEPDLEDLGNQSKLKNKDTEYGMAVGDSKQIDDLKPDIEQNRF